MPKYLIEGKTVVTETPLSEDEIDEIASSIKPSMPVAKLQQNQPKKNCLPQVNLLFVLQPLE